MKLMRELTAKPAVKSAEQVVEASTQHDPDELFDQFMDAHARNSYGHQGLVSLAKLSRALGYMDRNYYGQLDRDASLGDITKFLEDNPGAIEAIYEWVRGNLMPEWVDNISEYMENNS